MDKMDRKLQSLYIQQQPICIRGVNVLRIQAPKGKQDCHSFHIKNEKNTTQHNHNKTSSEQNTFKTKKPTYARGFSAKTVAVQNRLHKDVADAGHTFLQIRSDSFEKELELEAKAREKKVRELFEKQKSQFLKMFERQRQTEKEKIKAEAYHKLEAIYFEEIKRLQGFIQGTINKPLVKGLLLNHAYLDKAILRNWKRCLEEKKQAVLETIRYERETAKRQAGIRQQEYDLNKNMLVEKHEEELRLHQLQFQKHLQISLLSQEARFNAQFDLSRKRQLFEICLRHQQMICRKNRKIVNEEIKADKLRQQKETLMGTANDCIIRMISILHEFRVFIESCPNFTRNQSDFMLQGLVPPDFYDISLKE